MVFTKETPKAKNFFFLMKVKDVWFLFGENLFTVWFLFKGAFSTQKIWPHCSSPPPPSRPNGDLMLGQDEWGKQVWDGEDLMEWRRGGRRGSRLRQAWNKDLFPWEKVRVRNDRNALLLLISRRRRMLFALRKEGEAFLGWQSVFFPPWSCCGGSTTPRRVRLFVLN